MVTRIVVTVKPPIVGLRLFVELTLDYFPQRLHNKLPLVHQRMGYLEVGVVDVEVVVQQDVDVDDAVVIYAVGRLLRPAHGALDGLRGFKHLARRERSGTAYGGVDKTVARLKTPRLSYEQG